MQHTNQKQLVSHEAQYQSQEQHLAEHYQRKYVLQLFAIPGEHLMELHTALQFIVELASVTWSICIRISMIYSFRQHIIQIQQSALQYTKLAGHV